MKKMVTRTRARAWQGSQATRARQVRTSLGLQWHSKTCCVNNQQNICFKRMLMVHLNIAFNIPCKLWFLAIDHFNVTTQILHCSI